ncbi:hypothetical protein B0A79_17080 [Flavobacterium piscis]|uniref:Uncharacterized protein n=1 Tax=Flavobacterium piscis TaxID=1114874 RepID=A0ABX2XG70_9FLAO|nr:hypothetical protein [Flavobacterium piscis]MCA1918206.1 cbb3-type cytochrome c oxidase subunit I [Flavobacterium piscis]OCB71968.1 hypothetical protein FLP_15730 [Flavobacterium piscis]OXG00931.1 hypothetical protein B0A79_17080 [Flavobacterium piscis]
MTIKNIKVYHLFWVVAIISLLIGVFNPEETLDINIHDTYFVIAGFHMAVVLFVCYFISGFAYWLIQKALKKPLIKYLTLIHSVILIGSYIFYWLIILYCKLFLSNHEFPLFDDGSRLISITLAFEFVLIIFVALPIFIVNLAIGILRKSN